MKYYINGKEVSRQEMKLEYYKENFRIPLTKIFINKYYKRNKKNIIAWSIVAILGLVLLVHNLIEVKAHYIPVKQKEVVEVKKEQVPEVRKTIEEEAFNLIAQFEGYSDKPYWDISQYSCGYGMRCSKDTTGITKEKSKQFVIERIRSIRDRYKLHQYDNKIEIALISFTYNIGHPPAGYRWFIANGYINGLKNRMKAYVYAGGKKLRGLEKRREVEPNIF